MTNVNYISVTPTTPVVVDPDPTQANCVQTFAKTGI